MNKQILMFCALLCGFTVISRAQSVPTFQGTTADNKKVSIPSEVNGKYTLLCFAASNKSQADLETWLEPVYNHYIAKTGIMDAAYDVNVFFVPVFKGANAAMKSTLKQKFRENAQQDLWPHILFCENDLSAVQSALNMTKDNVPYFSLLDKSGQIVYRTSGAYTEEKFDAMDEKVE
ncbi:MAG: hypothetical protein IPQ03_10920 [Bacteroidetes bacterium]|nr:hypothetical protein [Bacteroidota bacterium]